MQHEIPQKFKREQIDAYQEGSLHKCFGLALSHTRCFVKKPFYPFSRPPQTIEIEQNVIKGSFENSCQNQILNNKSTLDTAADLHNKGFAATPTPTCRGLSVEQEHRSTRDGSREQVAGGRSQIETYRCFRTGIAEGIVENATALLVFYTIFKAPDALVDGFVFQKISSEFLQNETLPSEYNLMEIKNIQDNTGDIYIDGQKLGCLQIELKKAFILNDDTDDASSLDHLRMGSPDKISEYDTTTFGPNQLVHACYGVPSIGFGKVLASYDDGSFLPRLPSPPFLPITEIRDVKENYCLSVFKVSPQDWFFKDQKYLPFAIYIEAALQPCGWLACIMCLPDFKETVYFRNLQGNIEEFQEIEIGDKELHFEIKLLEKFRFGSSMIVQFEVIGTCENQQVLKLSTKFGFYTEKGLQKQNCFDEFKPFERAHYQPIPLKCTKNKLSMIDDILYCDKKSIYGRRVLSPDDWYFKVHFFRDPVQPGSLGLEPLVELSKIYAERMLGMKDATLAAPIRWKYKGQVLPHHGEVEFQIFVNEITDCGLKAEGAVLVDGRCIYHLEELRLKF